MAMILFFLGLMFQTGIIASIGIALVNDIKLNPDVVFIFPIFWTVSIGLILEGYRRILEGTKEKNE